ncbi:hypothetical protein D9758_005831 [Tetrapyrgos nigripes]|uniref:Uncharacterized protein n=1 Tax=Tetrapyrgos nigripes TaxID=182062 RepID=A0A8H5G2X8_9AGAR|nr:hypothetical protein D9758_005831 [Tetrapyrgos nigripes]
MSSLDPVWLLLDDPGMKLGGTWFPVNDSRWLGNSTAFDGTENLPNSSLSVDFQGTSISFTGNTASSTNAPTSFLASIDSNEAYNVSIDAAGETQYYIQWYSTPTLPDGHHSINLTAIIIDIDYALITAGESTPFSSNSTIVVDNDHAEIWYSGNWARSDSFLETAPNMPDGPALGNSTHRCNTPGSSFEFHFSGTQVGVWGVFQWKDSGILDVDFILDNKTTSKAIFANTDPGFPEQRHYPFFNAEGLEGGNHTLVVNITQATGDQIFAFDYIFYTPDFTSLSTKPVFARPTDGSSTSPAEPSSTSSSSRTSPNIGAIVGGVVGGVVLLGILVGVFLLLRRRKTRVNSVVDIFESKDLHPPSHIIEPYPPHPISEVSSNFFSTSQATSGSKTLLQRSDHSISVQNGTALPQSVSELGSVSPQDGYTQVQIDELRRRIDYLAEENARVGVAAPPEYSSKFRV